VADFDLGTQENMELRMTPSEAQIDDESRRVVPKMQWAFHRHAQRLQPKIVARCDPYVRYSAIRSGFAQIAANDFPICHRLGCY